MKLLILLQRRMHLKIKENYKPVSSERLISELPFKVSQQGIFMKGSNKYFNVPFDVLLLNIEILLLCLIVNC
jgi:hypothetical protein